MQRLRGHSSRARAMEQADKPRAVRLINDAAEVSLLWHLGCRVGEPHCPVCFGVEMQMRAGSRCGHKARFDGQRNPLRISVTKKARCGEIPLITTSDTITGSSASLSHTSQPPDGSGKHSKRRRFVRHHTILICGGKPVVLENRSCFGKVPRLRSEPNGFGACMIAHAISLVHAAPKDSLVEKIRQMPAMASSVRGMSISYHRLWRSMPAWVQLLHHPFYNESPRLWRRARADRRPDLQWTSEGDLHCP